MMMMSLRQLGALSATDRRLVLEALALTIAVRVGLRLLPLTTVRRVLDRVARWHRSSRGTGAQHDPADRIVWAVRAAGSRLPATTCLVEALVADTLLRRHGHAPSLKIGVRRGTKLSLDAHAWVECNGTAVIGTTPAATEYLPLEPSRRGV